MNISVWLQNLLDYSVDKGVTDIQLEEDSFVYVRCENGLEKTSFYVDSNKFLDLYKAIGINESMSDTVLSIDQAFSYKDIRIRVHIYKADGKPCATLRILSFTGLSLEQDLDKTLLQSICSLKEGLVLITGPTGSGKSFVLATCISYINAHSQKHIVTLEDPIEFKFHNQQSLVHQRQLGSDITSMAHGIRDAVREDPDVIMVGELRDRPTVEAALHAAETGHLVLATMHTQSAVMAINRIISIFSGDQQDEVRSQLSQILKVVICQRLVRLSGQFITLRDILINTPAVANLIRLRKEPQIISIQETQSPMRTFNMSVNLASQQWGHESLFREALGG